MRKVSIFVLNIFQVGGIERIVTILANNLIKDPKFNVEIVSLFKTSDKPSFNIDERIVVKNIFEKSISIRKNFIKIVKTCKEFAAREDVDVFITAGMGYVPITWLSFNANMHIAWEHSNLTIGKRFGITWLGRQIARKYFDVIVVLTEQDMNNYKKQFNDEVNIKHIYNPIEFESSQIQYKSEDKKIISTGRLSRQKGFDILVDVAAIVFSRYPEWSWHIFGEGEQQVVIEEKISSYDLGNHVYLKGFTKDIKNVYKDYSLFVLTSRYEGFGLVITEAQSQKLPVVAFDCNCGPRELILNDTNGFLIENGNVEKMAEKICELIADKEKRIQFSNNTSLDKEKLRLENFVNDWKKIIEN
ncbi:glycosyltransferase family 4 protein [Planococcus donghaensis]|uniref:glycosyltransferase family 4 protein n=1 Tax=Planococcus donghaensis TaxID=414778 RepID=UPI003735569C